jgi:hypothetical protein
MKVTISKRNAAVSFESSDDDTASTATGGASMPDEKRAELDRLQSCIASLTSRCKQLELQLRDQDQYDHGGSFDVMGTAVPYDPLYIDVSGWQAMPYAMTSHMPSFADRGLDEIDFNPMYLPSNFSAA